MTRTARRDIAVAADMVDAGGRAVPYRATPVLDRLIDFLGDAATRDDRRQAAAIRRVVTLSQR